MGTIYKVLVEMTIPQLEHTVAQFLHKGWKLAGGVAVDAGGYKYQAIFREPLVTKEQTDAARISRKSQVEEIPGTE